MRRSAISPRVARARAALLAAVGATAAHLGAVAPARAQTAGGAPPARPISGVPAVPAATGPASGAAAQFGLNRDPFAMRGRPARVAAPGRPGGALLAARPTVARPGTLTGVVSAGRDGAATLRTVEGRLLVMRIGEEANGWRLTAVAPRTATFVAARGRGASLTLAVERGPARAPAYPGGRPTPGQALFGPALPGGAAFPGAPLQGAGVPVDVPLLPTPGVSPGGGAYAAPRTSANATPNLTPDLTPGDVPNGLGNGTAVYVPAQGTSGPDTARPPRYSPRQP